MKILVLLLAVTLTACSTNNQPLSQTGSLSNTNTKGSSGVQLTKEQAQAAVDIAFEEVKQKAAHDWHRYFNKSTARAVVEGIQELPQNNSATAAIKFLDADYPAPGGPYSLDRGFAYFTRYNDGRWFLTHFNPNSTWISPVTTNIEVKR